MQTVQQSRGGGEAQDQAAAAEEEVSEAMLMDELANAHFLTFFIDF